MLKINWWHLGSDSLRWGASVALVLSASQANAASSPEGAVGAISAPAGGLEEIIVSAQRREESLDKVPVSVTALSQKTMDDLHLQSFADLASVVPGIVVSTPGGTDQSSTDVAIRGIFSGGNAPTTGIYIDETPIVVRQNRAAGFSGSPQPDIFDLERIEVLRGPQGTLFGSGAMGGAIRYITPQPNLRDADGYAKAEFGYTDRGSPSYAVGVAYGAPVIPERMGFRLSGWYHSDGGFIDIEDPYTGQIVKRNANSSYSYVFRPSFAFVASEGLTITAAAFLQHHHSDQSDEYWRTLMPNPEAGAHVSGFGEKIPQTVRDDLNVFSLGIKYDLRGMSLQSDTSYVDRSYNDFDDWSNILPAFFGTSPVDPGLAPFAFWDENIVWTRAWQQEFRLTSQDSDSRLNWVAGAYYRHALDGVSQYIAGDLSPITELLYGQSSLDVFGVPNYVVDGQQLSSYTWFTTVTEQKALFGELTYKILPRLRANLGVRVERSVVKQQRQIFAGPFNGVAYASTVLPDEAETPITPRLGMTYQFTDEHMVYATAAKGYRAGGSNSPIATDDPLCAPSVAALGLKAVPTSFDSDRLWSYEVGAKDSFFNRRVAMQTSAFYIDWTKIQTAVNLPSCGQNFTTNRGRAVSRGFDFQIAAVVTDSLKLSANVGYTDAYYPRAGYGPATSGVAPLLNGAGDKLAAVLPWTASVHAEYARDIGRLWKEARAYVRIDYRWLDAAPKANPNVTNYDPDIGPFPNQAYEILNVRMGLLRGGLDLSAFVNNATNSDPRLALDHPTPGDPLYAATAIRPLTAGVTALYRF